jgi:DNA-binding NtrC family response regulator
VEFRVKLLLLDDDTQLRLKLEDYLSAERIEIVAQPDPILAIGALGQDSWVGAVVCLDTGDGAATAFLEALTWVEGLDIPVVITSATVGVLDEDYKLARELCPDAAFIRKPVQLRRLRQALGPLEASAVHQPVKDPVDLPTLETDDLKFLDDDCVVELLDSETMDSVSEPTVIEPRR